MIQIKESWMGRTTDVSVRRNARRGILVGAAALVASTVLASCSLGSGQAGPPDDGASDGSNDVTVGVVLPFSGAVSRTGNLYRNGVELRLQEAVDSGELGDIKVTLQFEDDANDPNEAVTLATKFADEGAVALIGAHSSPVALAQAATVESAKMPEFVFGASNAIENPYQYQVNARDSEQIKNVLNFAEANGYDTIGLLTDTGAYGANALTVLQDTIGASDLKIVGSETFEPGASDVTPQLVALRGANPDFIAMFSFGTPYAAVVQGRAQVGWDIDIVGNVAAGDIAIGEIAGEDATGLYYMSPLDTSSAEGAKLLAAWQDAYPDAPLTFEGAIAYDTMTVIIRALTEGGTSRAAVQDWLQSADAVDGLVSGTIPWDVASRHGLKAGDLSFRVWDKGENHEAGL